MRTLALIRFALTISAAALIGGCSGSQLTVGPPGAMPRSNTPHLPNTDRYAVLFNFGTSSGSCVDGAYPTWGLVPMNGLLYGSTYEGGTNYSERLQHKRRRYTACCRRLPLRFLR